MTPMQAYPRSISGQKTVEACLSAHNILFSAVLLFVLLPVSSIISLPGLRQLTETHASCLIILRPNKVQT